ncbi:2 cyclic-nucleotide 3-phosphodiesterase [Diplodia corticola]|uniref:2 cyclic-nucleotide 3-phosphodiesterase n=1 Tax=Diplodia corticola TaxID=236234 RepID=A0A1J9RBW3_9PEZI|nr:2 cyclic-nucleotide 3-phosphodiesterase [Diplodia corticola]OJD37642.1 2 cyclic-nucleotide 3-phosphodiesterase [Diplodia corticola]
MPGFSLWLVPPVASSARAALSALIAESLPAQFPTEQPPPPRFVPHVTLTSDVQSDVFSKSSDEQQQKRDARAWLEGLADLPAGRDVRVRFETLDVGEKFVQKLTLRVLKEGGLRELARVSRLHGVEGGSNVDAVETWLDRAYRPHCSLVYGNMPISDQKKAELQSVVEQAGISIFGSGDLGGWEGGLVWLVPTFKTIPEWEPWVEVAL